MTPIHTDDSNAPNQPKLGFGCLLWLSALLLFPLFFHLQERLWIAQYRWSGVLIKFSWWLTWVTLFCAGWFCWLFIWKSRNIQTSIRMVLIVAVAAVSPYASFLTLHIGKVFASSVRESIAHSLVKRMSPIVEQYRIEHQKKPFSPMDIAPRRLKWVYQFSAEIGYVYGDIGYREESYFGIDQYWHAYDAATKQWERIEYYGPGG
jgi:hypothetical protein